ncbi:MAG: hypothetical protein IJ715_04875 [Bacilli bacterium]|nr:hypothetical protein [Bacilli bacterium]
MTIKKNDNKYLVFLRIDETKKLNFKDFDNLEYFFINVFTHIKNKYNHFENGLYKLNIYLDKYYGAVIEIKNLKNNYYLDSQLDMTINIIDDNFLYLVDNYDFDKNNFEYYSYKGNIYAKIISELSEKELFKLYENSEIFFNTEKLIISSKKI